MNKSEQTTADWFAERYRVAPAEVSRRIELAVLGGDWGANGYTTMVQADMLARELGLRPGVRLLDLGAGEQFAVPPAGTLRAARPTSTWCPAKLVPHTGRHRRH